MDFIGLRTSRAFYFTYQRSTRVVHDSKTVSRTVLWFCVYEMNVELPQSCPAKQLLLPPPSTSQISVESSSRDGSLNRWLSYPFSLLVYPCGDLIVLQVIALIILRNYHTTVHTSYLVPVPSIPVDLQAVIPIESIMSAPRLTHVTQGVTLVTSCDTDE